MLACICYFGVTPGSIWESLQSLPRVVAAGDGLPYLEGLELEKDARYLTVSNMVYEASVIIGKPSALVRSEFESHYYRHRYMAMPVLTG